MIRAISTVRRSWNSRNSAFLEIPMAILRDENFPFRLRDGSEMPERLEVELAISGGSLIVTPLDPRPPIVDDIQSLYDS